VLTYHVVPVPLTAQELMETVKEGGGMTTLKTMQGETLTVMQAGNGLGTKDKNGVIHVVSSVLLPG
jgi:uncharacterized surface protein with fasciclin (FAS1) repeats